MTDLDRMEAGELYWGFNPDFEQPLKRGQELCFRYNQLPPSDITGRRRIIEAFFRKIGDNTTLHAPIHIDFGNIEIGDSTIINFNFVALDEALIFIGNHCFIGPNCSIYTVTHSLCYEDRNMGLMTAKPVVINDKLLVVW